MSFVNSKNRPQNISLLFGSCAQTVNNC